MRKLSAIILAISLILCALPASAADAGIVTLSGGSLNVRTSANTGGQIAARLSNGSYITLISKSGAWWYVEYAPASYGWCHSSYITEKGATAATVSITSGSLNVRSGAGTAYAKTGSLLDGTQVLILGTSNGWSRILYNGSKTGYVNSDYLKSASGYAKVSLNVPSYKQTDSRWANVKISASGKTMSQIGCTTTAIAMLESYRSGVAIHPNTMASRLSYTASGNVYWPSDYKVVTNSADYLSGIYEKLRQGKPVLFGAKTASSKQHWVVITGYTGGTGLTPSSFKINDPGSASRTTLAQFLNAYPIFYKYFHY